MTIVVLLILAGVSLNAIIGENGVITNAANAKFESGISALEEFIQEKYIENYDNLTGKDNKVLGLIETPSTSGYFYKPQIGLSYVVDSDGHSLYLINKDGLPKEIKDVLVGGEAGNKEYIDYLELNDVYGVTSSLKVYYCKKRIRNNKGSIKRRFRF